MSSHSDKLGVLENAITIKAQEVARSEMESLFSSLELELRTKAGVNTGTEALELQHAVVQLYEVIRAVREYAISRMSEKVALELAEDILANSGVIEEEYAPAKAATDDDF